MVEKDKRKELEDANQEWLYNANDVINLKLVTSRSDLDDSSKNFHPEFSHQIFQTETF